MLLLIGIIAGVVISLLGSAILSLYPYLPFVPIFSTTLIPSILIYVIVSYEIKPRSSKLKCWLSGFISLFIISILSFAIKNYFQLQAISNNPGSSLNWDAVIIANIIYSLGAAILISPIGYFAIKKIVRFKNKMY